MFVSRAVRTCILGAAVALLPLTAAHATSFVDRQKLKALQRSGECQTMFGANRGVLCVRRDADGPNSRLRYYFTFDGIWTHVNVHELQTQYELSRVAGNRTITRQKPAAKGELITLRVQACQRPAGLFSSSKCTLWTDLHIRM